MDNNVAPNIPNFSVVIDMLYYDESIGEAQAMLQHMIERGEAPKVIDDYCLHGQMKDDLVSFNTMIN